MKLRKLIPAVLTVLLAVTLSLGLFVTAVPQAMATEEPEAPQVWEQIQSGYLYGTDWTLYPFTYTLYVEDDYFSYDSNGEPCLDPEEPDSVKASIYVDYGSGSPKAAGIGTQCVMEVELYIPELDRYVTRTVSGRSCTVSMSDAEDMHVYPGEVLRVTAWFFVMERHVGTLQWFADQT